MAKKNTQKSKPVAATAITNPVKAKPEHKGIIKALDSVISKREKGLFIFIFLTGILFTILQFDVKLGTGHDDALYVEAGYRFFKEFPHYYYTANAPLYPMFLALPIAILGLNLIQLKIISVILMWLFIFITYISFRNLIPKTILFFVIFTIAINPSFIFFASMTHSEAFYLFIQALFYFVSFKLITKIEDFNSDIKATWKYWLLLGLMTQLLILTKTIAHAAVAAMVVYFITQKQYKNIFYSIASWLVFRELFELIKKITWGSVGSNVSGQWGILMQKNPYSAAEGYDDFGGFVMRFVDNLELYLSKRFFQILGFQSDKSLETNVFLTLIVILLFVFGLYQAFKYKNKFLLYAGLCSGAVAALTFFMLQKTWDQPRFVLVHIPVMLITIFYGLYTAIINRKTYSFPLEFSVIITFLIILLVGFGNTFSVTAKNYAVLRKNLKGNIYYGYTPDWINYLQMSEWCGKNLPDTAVVACRKAPMSFIYAHGREFFPIYSVSTNNADTLLANFKKDKVSYVIMASLRRNPNSNTGEVINTIQRMLQPINEKYPEKLKMVKQIGDSEPAYLFQIKY